MSSWINPLQHIRETFDNWFSKNKTQIEQSKPHAPRPMPDDLMDDDDDELDIEKAFQNIGCAPLTPLEKNCSVPHAIMSILDVSQNLYQKGKSGHELFQKEHQRIKLADAFLNEVDAHTNGEGAVDFKNSPRAKNAFQKLEGFHLPEWKETLTSVERERLIRSVERVKDRAKNRSELIVEKMKHFQDYAHKAEQIYIQMQQENHRTVSTLARNMNPRTGG